VSVRVSKLSFAFDAFALSVEGIEFEHAKVTSIVGRNGAGKSTLLKCLAAILPVPKGSVFCGGRDISLLPSGQKARLICYVSQEHSLSLNYSVLDVVLMGRASYISVFSVPSIEDFSAAREAMNYVGLSGFEGRLFSELSSGERRLVLIARTLAQQPDILLLDEPTTFLDPKHEVEIMDLCRKMASEKGKTVVITQHNLDMALNYSDRLVFLKHGRVVAEGPPDQVLSENLLEDVYDMPMTIVSHQGKKLILR
jgi:iron complex transport system ATP-binding protein